MEFREPYREFRSPGAQKNSDAKRNRWSLTRPSLLVSSHGCNRIIRRPAFERDPRGGKDH